MNQDNYIIETWGLPTNLKIDFNKTKIYRDINHISILELYLIEERPVCPFCDSSYVFIRGSKTQNIKCSLINNEAGIIIFHKRIYKCMSCSKMFRERIFNDSSHISLSLKLSILDALKDTRNTFKMVSEKYNVSVSYIEEIFDRYIIERRKKLSEVLCIDEIYSRKLTKTKYSCIFYDPIKDKIIDVLDSRRLNVLENYLYHINLDEINNVRYFVSDLNETYRTVYNRFFENAIYAVDSFHVIKNLVSLFNELRIRIMKKYEYLKDVKNSSYWLFKKFYKLLLIDYNDIVDKEYSFRKYDMILDKHSLICEILKVDDDLRVAYDLLYNYRWFNNNSTIENAKERLEDLIIEFRESNVPEMERFGLLLIHWKKEIVNSFIRVNGWRLSNGRFERANRYIKLMFSNAFGYTNFERARKRIMYSYNKETLYSNKK